MESLETADPRSVGGYPLFARLGAGGMGQVYLARTPAGRALALKTVRSEFGQDPGFGERFAREIRHADRVRSPWTVAVVDFSPAGTRPPWLATEYVAAPSLAEWVAAHGPLPEPAVAVLAAELCEALRAVHAAGLAHRDVKPSNVLLGPERPLLIDFGIARAAEDSRHTRTGGVIGSPGYMAPEQATAGASAEPGDLFALAAVLVYAATGHGPFNKPGEEPSAPALLYRIVHEDADLDGLPESLAPLVHACLAKEPADRPTAPEAAERLLAAGHRAGGWPQVTPPGLTADLRGRESTVRALLADPTAAVGPSPYAPTARVTATTPGYPQSPHTPVPAPGRQQYAPQGGQAPGRPPYVQQRVPAPAPAGWGRPQPGPGRPPGRPSGRPAWLPALLIAGGIILVLILIGVLVDQRRGSNDDNGNGGTPDPSTSTSASASTSTDALPAAWVGTWLGKGPGDPSPSGAGATRTDRFDVTLTLVPGARGSVVGKQVSEVDEVGTGRDVGCTETLRLTTVRSDTMVFTAVSAAPTDPSSDGYCPTGNTYTVGMTGPSSLRLETGGASGSPSVFTKQK